MLVSDSFGGKGEETNSEAFLVRSGVDCNHLSSKSIQKDNQGHFGPENWFQTDEKGMMCVYALFGNNHACVFTNDSRYGNLRECVFVNSIDSSSTRLPLNINGNAYGEMGAGLTLVICSGGSAESVAHALYLVRSGFKDNNFRSKLLCGEDKFVFSEIGGILHVDGPEGAQYAVCHNRGNLEQSTSHAYVAQKQSVNGTVPVMLCDKVPQQASFVVLCSNSCGSEDSSVACIYFVKVSNNKVIEVKEISGLHSKLYTSSDLWTFEIINNRLQVKGPEGPCKYGLMSNVPATPDELKSTLQQSSCLATGESTQTVGQVTITQDGVSGEINKSAAVEILWNHKILTVIPQNKLTKSERCYSFSYNFPTEEKVVGYHLVRVFALRSHIKSK